MKYVIFKSAINICLYVPRVPGAKRAETFCSELKVTKMNACRKLN